MDSQFRVLFAGEIRQGVDPQHVRQKLASLHKVSLQQIETLFSGKSTVVKVANDYATAQKIQQAYSNAGAICTIEGVNEGNLQTPSSLRPSIKETSQNIPTMRCPKCGVEQAYAESCMHCGAIITKFQQQKPRSSSEASPSCVTITDVLETTNTKFEVLTYTSLSGSDNLIVAQMIHHASQSGVKLKQVRITLSNSEVMLEAGALHFLKGNITIENTIGGIGGLLKKAASKVLTNETAFKPTYKGSGEIYLEPGFGHFILMRLENEEMITDKGMFLCCQTSIEAGVASQKGISAGLLGGEGWFQTKLSGRGICVLQSPVPVEEIIKLQLRNETVQVDGNFALLRKGKIDFTVERSSKSLLGSMTSGEGLLQTFRGTGEVWLAPTQSIYERLVYEGMGSMSRSAKSFGTKTQSDRSK